MAFTFSFRRLTLAALWTALAAYVAACVASVVAIFVSTEALTGVFAIMLATPWMFAVEAVAPDGMWALIPVIAAMGVNAAILYFCIRLVRRV